MPALSPRETRLQQAPRRSTPLPPLLNTSPSPFVQDAMARTASSGLPSQARLHLQHTLSLDGVQSRPQIWCCEG